MTALEPKTGEPKTDFALYIEFARDLVGLAGLVLVCVGVFLIWGTGWTCIVAGAPIFSGYAWREVRNARAADRRRG